ncbi:MAG: nuclear transport factor 2 family protein [Pseudomonadales bacterium]|nr:nuclear transport factor 2 family protein [Pseudomonadales bacterium]
MSTENKALVRAYLQAFSEGKLDSIDELTPEDYRYHGPGEELTGRKALKDQMRFWKAAFPDSRSDYPRPGRRVRQGRYPVSGGWNE